MKTHLLLIALVFVVGCASPPAKHGIPNLAPVDPAQNIWRGGQPNLEGWRYLRAVGVTNVIRLSPENDGEPESVATVMGMTVHRYPLTGWQQFWGHGVGEAMVAAEREIVPGTYFHCRRGRDRTGTLGYWHRRMTGWPHEAALAEAKSYGWGSSLPGLKWWVWKQYQHEKLLPRTEKNF